LDVKQSSLKGVTEKIVGATLERRREANGEISLDCVKIRHGTVCFAAYSCII
jgi:hypothetical protein